MRKTVHGVENKQIQKCKVASKVIAASMAVAMVITMAGCGRSGKKVEARDTIYISE